MTRQCSPESKHDYKANKVKTHLINGLLTSHLLHIYFPSSDSPTEVLTCLIFYVHVEVCSEEISSNSLVWHYYLWPKTPQNSTVVFVMCKNITFFACLGLGLAHMQGFRFRIGTLPLWSRILPTNEKLFKKFENGKFMSWIKNWIGSFPKYWYNDLSFGIWIGLART